MDWAAKLDVLLRERQLARRKVQPLEHDISFMQISRKAAFRDVPEDKWEKAFRHPTLWQRLTWGNRFRAILKDRERFAKSQRDIHFPAPKTQADLELCRQNRSLSEIEAEIAAIPPVTIACNDVDPTEISGLGGISILTKAIEKRFENSLGGSKPPISFAKISTTWHPAMGERTSNLLGGTPANSATLLHVSKDSSPYPVRSSTCLREGRNYDGREYKHGRHFEMSMLLSPAMYDALTDVVPKTETSSRTWHKSRHVLCAPVYHDDQPRALAESDTSQFINFPKIRLTQLLICEYTSTQEDSDLVRVICLTENA